MIDNGKGQPVAHPAWVEARQQANILKQLIAALRLPDEATGKRPQHRGARGSYAPSTTGRVSSLDMARKARA
jgi:23S rRNA maturation mini-RNase III